ncbi:pyridoxal phosphate-dependent aminotransferase [Dissulfurirhabdus thermomarina]|uniref:Aminotransferase n=2 Tax=Dissulfurirhabdus thermomarina TaxID=1765737 RepID=A0A6N9TL51_DISTH|nr:pyridoxal phosphate-dependent aminotransferase [Dissulfurirhabdus thermomarina]NMX24013.1 pyridoxal phosphate-dependent aminotransferase [Dissulfurirhabdus thermomarina]
MDPSAVSRKMRAFMEGGSWIRKMFEEGARLKARHGADAVCDFSLGNPDLSPPEAFTRSLWRACGEEAPLAHGYMPNAGYGEVRERVARHAAVEQGVPLGADDVLMTCGAAGGLNVVFKAILDPGDEVVVPAPYFVEYRYYVDNHGGVLVPVPSRPDFGLDLAAIEAAVGPRTRAVLLNSPNNPTGVIYDAESLAELAGLLRRVSARRGRPVYLVADEPYRRLAFSGHRVPPFLALYPDSLVATSFSKDLSVPGERIGYVAVNPAAAGRGELLGALTLANRILGYVNAPALMQRAVAACLDACVDVGVYERRRDRLAAVLEAAGYEFQLPMGTFYFFPKTPIPDDRAFVRLLQEERILAVPGSGFGAPGYMRVAFCVADEVIDRAAEGFRRARERALAGAAA